MVITVVEQVTEVVQVTETSPGGTTASSPGTQGLKGDQGDRGPAGPSGPQGPPGGAGSTYIHTQMIPAQDWHIVHNLGRIPGGLLVLDSGSPPTEIMGEVTQADLVSMTIHFYNPQVGTATLS